MRIYILISCFIFLAAACDTKPVQYEFPPVEALPVQEGLPDPFLMADGSRVENRDDWKQQRNYLKEMLTHYFYGEMPPKPASYEIEELSEKLTFHDSIREIRFRMVLSHNGHSSGFSVGIRVPNRPGRFPAIIKNDSWIFDIGEVSNENRREKYKRLGRDKIEDYVAREAYRRGYVICKFNRNEVASDSPDSKSTGVLALYPEYNWGAIPAWAWTYQVLIDYLETQDYTDAEQICATGHSRGGKTALCAGIYEKRIGVTAPSSSGGGGTASWRYFEEGKERQLIEHHQSRFPHWWTPGFFDFAGREDRLPWDAHTLKALIAPRGLINVHSRDDYWANPYGTQLTYLAAEIVYDWLGATGRQGVHWRNGPHNQNTEDWHALFEFCDHYFFGRDTEVDFTQNPHPDRYDFTGMIPFEAPAPIQ